MAEENRKPNLRDVVARAWRDAAFKARLLSDPHAALAEAGADLPAGVTVKVLEDTSDTVHIVIPARPSGELSDEELDRIAGAGLGVMFPSDQNFTDDDSQSGWDPTQFPWIRI